MVKKKETVTFEIEEIAEVVTQETLNDKLEENANWVLRKNGVIDKDSNCRAGIYPGQIYDHTKRMITGAMDIYVRDEDPIGLEFTALLMDGLSDEPFLSAMDVFVDSDDVQKLKRICKKKK